MRTSNSIQPTSKITNRSTSCNTVHTHNTVYINLQSFHAIAELILSTIRSHYSSRALLSIYLFYCKFIDDNFSEYICALTLVI